jgi:hypothetical protein
MKRRKLKAPIVALNYIAGIVFMISICGLDSVTYFFHYAMGISGAWLVFMGCITGVIGGEYDV